MTSFVVRQPVMDRNQETFGYEFLFPCEVDDGFLRVDAGTTDQTSVPNVNHLTGLDQYADGRKCFVHLARKQLLEQAYLQLPARDTIVQVRESEQFDPELLEACEVVRRSGYALALDDFVVDPQWQSLLQEIDLLKADFTTLTDERHDLITRSSRACGFSIVAEKLSTHQEFVRACDLGYTYFQGSFYCRPDLTKSHGLAPAQLQYLRLLQIVNQPDFCIDEIETLVSSDVALTVKLLRYLNTPKFGLRTEVSSIRQAVGIIGHRPLKKWVSLITVSELCLQKPAVLMNTSLIRAKFCETIGQRALGSAAASECFLVGMLSLLDAILDQPMDVILDELALATTLRETLLQFKSPMRSVLDLAKAIENGDWRWISALVYELHLEGESYYSEYRNAVVWAHDVLNGLD